MSMWEPFSEHARRAMVAAQEVALRFGNDFIGPDHIFAGIMSNHESGGAQVVASFGVDEARVLQAAQAVLAPDLPRGEDRVAQERIKEMIFDPRAKRLIEGSFEDARSLGHNYVGVEHMLLGYLRVCEPGEGLLPALNIEPDMLRARLLEALRTSGEPATLDVVFDSFPQKAEPQELWSALRRSVEEQDAARAMAYALRIGRSRGWNARAAAAVVAKLSDESSGPQTSS